MEILQEAGDVTGSRLSEQVMLISPFDVKLEEAPNFLRSWQQKTEQLKQQQGFIQARLHQSIQENPKFRFVNMARWGSPATLSATLGELDSPDLYRQVVEQVGYETEYQNHVTVINFMEIAKEEADSVAEGWSQASLPIAQLDGFISATLYRAINPEARFQFVNYAQWHSTEVHRKFRQQLAAASHNVTVHSGLYQVALASEGVKY